jgi:heme iron utilization protein
LTPSARRASLNRDSPESLKAAMANATADPHDAHAEAVADAKRLMRLARTGALATLEAAGAGPLTTLVGVASDFDGAALFLMSRLSRHTSNLARDPRASLLLTGEHHRGDPLNHPRVTLGGRVGACDDARGRARYLRRNPKAALYAGFADFAFFRLAVEGVHFNGGFGRAAALTPADVLASREGEAALMEAEERLIAEVNALGPAAVAGLAGLKATRPAWRAIGLDGEGLDLAAGARAARVQFPAPAHDPGSWRARLKELLASA